MNVVRGVYLIHLTLELFYSGSSCQEPCSTAPHGSEVIDICSQNVIQQPRNSPFLLRVSTVQICQCVLSVLNSTIYPTEITFSKYLSLVSSHPGYLPCGVALKFADKGNNYWNIFWNIGCEISNIRIFSLKRYHDIIIESYTINGSLSQGKGYCIEIESDIYTKLQLRCDSKSVSTKAIPVTISQSTEQTMTNNISDYDKQTQKGDTNTTVVSAVGGSIGGLVLVAAIVIVFVLRNRSKKSHTEYQRNELNAQDADGLHYNELYQSSERTNYSSANTGYEHVEHEMNKNEGTIEGHYNIVDIDDIQEGKKYSATVEQQKGDRSGIDPLHNHSKQNIQTLNQYHSESRKVKHINTLNIGCEYAVVDKTMKTKSLSQPPRPTYYTTPSGDVYAEVNKLNTSSVAENGKDEGNIATDGEYVNLAIQ